MACASPQSTGIPRKERVQRNGTACGKKLYFATWYLLGGAKAPAIKHKSPGRSGIRFFTARPPFGRLRPAGSGKSEAVWSPRLLDRRRGLSLRRPARCRRCCCGRDWRFHSSGGAGRGQSPSTAAPGESRPLMRSPSTKRAGTPSMRSDSASFIEARTWLSSCRPWQASRPRGVEFAQCGLLACDAVRRRQSLLARLRSRPLTSWPW